MVNINVLAHPVHRNQNTVGLIKKMSRLNYRGSKTFKTMYHAIPYFLLKVPKNLHLPPKITLVMRF